MQSPIPSVRPYLPFARPDLDESEAAEVLDCLKSGWITTGPKVKDFERLIGDYVGATHAVAVNSATAAMHLALEAIDLRPGELVFIPAYTFTATAEVVRYFDAIPVLIDSDFDDLNLSASHLACLLEAAQRGQLKIGDGRQCPSESARCRAVIPVHLAGQPARMDDFYTLAYAHGLSIIEDAAHALTSSHRGRRIGATPSSWRQASSTSSATSGGALPTHATCFSFYATKTLATGEGGMIVTDDEALAERCRVMSLHGISRDAWKRYSSSGSWYYEVQAPGFKYNLTDLAAAVGIAQFAKLERMWRRRCDIAAAYSAAFSNLADYVQLPTQRSDDTHAWHLYLLRLNVQTDGDESNSDALRLTRDQFIEQLRNLGIGTSVHFIPLHLHPYYRNTYGYRPQDFPVAYREYQRVVSLPIYSRMTDADVERVIESVHNVILTNAA